MWRSFKAFKCVGNNFNHLRNLNTNLSNSEEFNIAFKKAFKNAVNYQYCNPNNSLIYETNMPNLGIQLTLRKYTPDPVTYRIVADFNDKFTKHLDPLKTTTFNEHDVKKVIDSIGAEKSELNNIKYFMAMFLAVISNP